MKKKLLALLMVLPLVACGPTTGGDGTGSSGTGSGGEQNPPIVPPTPTPVEVKRSELLSLFEEFCTSISGEAYKATNDDWDSEYDCFYSCFEFGDKNDGYTWEDAIADAKECLPEGYEILNACHQFTWDDGSKGLEEDYIYDDKVVINVGTEEDDQGIVYVDIEVTAADNTTLIDDVGVLTKTTVLNFYDIDVQGNIYDPTPNEQLISYINSQQDEDVVSSITCSKSQMMHFQQDGVNYVNIFCIGSGSTGDTVTFKFSVNVVSITITACAYWKYIPYSGTYSVDADAAMYVNDDDHKMNITPKDTTSEPTTDTQKFEFPEGTKTLSLYNKEAKQRSLLYSLTIEYK